MMNYIWVALAVIAVIAGGATGTMDKVLENIFSFAETAVMDIALPLTGIMAFFCGVMKVMERAGLCEKLGKHCAGHETFVPGCSGRPSCKLRNGVVLCGKYPGYW